MKFNLKYNLKKYNLKYSLKDSRIILLIFILSLFVLFLLTFNVRADTIQKDVLFITGSHSFFNATLKFSTTGVSLIDSGGNTIEDGDFVCDLTKDSLTRDNIFTSDSGEWYFNGGQVASPEIIWNKELVEVVRERISNDGCRFNNFCPSSPSFSGWNVYDILPDNSKNELDQTLTHHLNNSNRIPGLREGNVVCGIFDDGIKCFAFVKGGAGWYCIYAPCGHVDDFLVVSKDEFDVGALSELLSSDTSSSGDSLSSLFDSVDFVSVDSSDVDYGFVVDGFNVSLLDDVLVSFKLVNDGDIPLRVKGFSVLFGDDKVGFVDVLKVNGSEVEPNDSVDVILKLDKFFDDPCELLNNKLKVVVFYDAPRFKCDFTIDDEVVYDYVFSPDLNAGYELKEFLPKDDLFVYSKQPRKTKDNRIDLHVGKDDNNGLSRTIILFDKKKLGKELDVDKVLKAKLLLSVRDVVDYEGESDEQVVNAFEVIKDVDADRINWFRQPKINDESFDSFTAKKGEVVSVDVTHCLKTKDCYGVVLRADDESEKKETIINALESEEKPTIKVYYETDKTLGDVCVG